MQLLIAAIVAVIFLVGVVAPCPSVCRCTDNSDVLNKQILVHKNLICSKKNNVYLTYFFIESPNLTIENGV
jgi:hypothetical protein